MPADVVSIAAARRRRAEPPRNRLAAQAELRGRSVVILARDRDTYYTPAAVRSLARGLLTLADAVDSGVPVTEVCEAEARARLAMIGQMVEGVACGEAGLSELIGLIRQLTGEVRGG